MAVPNEYRGFTRASLDKLCEAYSEDLMALSSPDTPDDVKALIERQLRENDERITDASIACLVLSGIELSELQGPDDIADKQQASACHQTRNLSRVAEILGTARPY